MRCFYEKRNSHDQTKQNYTKPSHASAIDQPLTTGKKLVERRDCGCLPLITTLNGIFKVAASNAQGFDCNTPKPAFRKKRWLPSLEPGK